MKLRIFLLSILLSMPLIAMEGDENDQNHQNTKIRIKFNDQPLLYALERGHVEDALSLLKEGASYELIRSDGNNILHVAAQTLSSKDFEKLLVALPQEFVRKFLNKQNDQGIYPVDSAFIRISKSDISLYPKAEAKQKIKFYEMLIKYGVAWEESVSPVVDDPFLVEIFSKATKTQYFQDVIMRLPEKVRADLINQRTPEYRTILTKTICEGNWEKALFLIKNGADFLSIGNDQRNILHYASLKFSQEQFQEFLTLFIQEKRKFFLNMKFQGKDLPIHLALRSKNADVATFLLEHEDVHINKEDASSILKGAVENLNRDQLDTFLSKFPEQLLKTLTPHQQIEIMEVQNRDVIACLLSHGFVLTLSESDNLYYSLMECFRKMVHPTFVRHVLRELLVNREESFYRKQIFCGLGICFEKFEHPFMESKLGFSILSVFQEFAETKYWRELLNLMRGSFRHPQDLDCLFKMAVRSKTIKPLELLVVALNKKNQSKRSLLIQKCLENLDEKVSEIDIPALIFLTSETRELRHHRKILDSVEGAQEYIRIAQAIKNVYGNAFSKLMGDHLLNKMKNVCQKITERNRIQDISAGEYLMTHMLSLSGDDDLLRIELLNLSMPCFNEHFSWNVKLALLYENIPFGFFKDKNGTTLTEEDHLIMKYKSILGTLVKIDSREKDLKFQDLYIFITRFLNNETFPFECFVGEPITLTPQNFEGMFQFLNEKRKKYWEIKALKEQIELLKKEKK